MNFSGRSLHNHDEVYEGVHIVIAQMETLAGETSHSITTTIFPDRAADSVALGDLTNLTYHVDSDGSKAAMKKAILRARRVVDGFADGSVNLGEDRPIVAETWRLAADERVRTSAREATRLELSEEFRLANGMPLKPFIRRHELRQTVPLSDTTIYEMERKVPEAVPSIAALRRLVSR